MFSEKNEKKTCTQLQTNVVNGSNDNSTNWSKVRKSHGWCQVEVNNANFHSKKIIDRSLWNKNKNKPQKIKIKKKIFSCTGWERKYVYNALQQIHMLLHGIVDTMIEMKAEIDDLKKVKQVGFRRCSPIQRMNIFIQEGKKLLHGYLVWQH